MRKVVFLWLAVCVAAFTAVEAGELSGKKLRVGTMAIAPGLPVHYAEKMGFFKDAGLDVEVIVFPTGAPINEAMGAGELDVAVSGMASVYALATGRYTYIGDGVITLEGQAIYARPNHPIVQAKVPGTNYYGSKELLRDVSILGPLATSVHFVAIKYVETFGLTSDDFNMVSMDYPQAYQAFVTGQGDLIATVTPYSSQLEEAGYVNVYDLTDALGAPLVDANYVQNDVLQDRRQDLVEFLDCYYRAAEELIANPEQRKQIAMTWYAEEGRNYTEADMEVELRRQTYPTYDTLLTDKLPFGRTMESLVGFFVDQGMIDPENGKNVPACMDPSLIQELKNRRK